jgi:conjugal transfer pilus assembly protein TraU
MKRLIALLASALLTASVAVADDITQTTETIDPTCPDAGFFSSKLIDGICWDCLYFNLAGIEMNRGAGKPDDAADRYGACACPGEPLPKPGFFTAFEEPSDMIEVVRFPYCSPVLSGTRLSNSVRMIGGTNNTRNGGAKERAFYHYHHIKTPLMTMLDLFFEPECTDGWVDIDIVHMSEFDPCHNDPELCMLLNSEMVLFSSPVAQAACAIDAAQTMAGQHQDSLFWCAGTWGSMMPYGGFISGAASPVRESSLIAARSLAAAHRRGLAFRTMGDDAMCGKRVHPIIPKSQYRLGTFYPVPETQSLHRIGAHTFTWGEHRTIPGTGEDYVYLLTRFNDCCITFEER